MSKDEYRDLPPNDIEKAEGVFVEASKNYSGIPFLRAAVKAIPYLGGSLDTFFAWKGEKWRNERLMDFLDILDQRMLRIERSKILVDFESEDFLELIVEAMKNVAQAKSEQKRKCFCSIVVNKITTTKTWDEAIAASRLLASLEEIHISILTLAYSPYLLEKKKPFVGAKGIFLPNPDTAQKERGENLLIHFPHLAHSTLHTACEELTQKGLLHVNARSGTTGYSIHFLPTAHGLWFTKWITQDALVQ